MSDQLPNSQARENRQRDRQVRYFATLKVIAETLNNGVSLRQTFASTLPLVVELLQLHTGWLFLYDEQGEFIDRLVPRAAARAGLPRPGLGRHLRMSAAGP